MREMLPVDHHVTTRHGDELFPPPTSPHAPAIVCRLLSPSVAGGQDGVRQLLPRELFTFENESNVGYGCTLVR